MRIAILTYAYVPNFGANLQAFSTYSYLCKLGHEAYLILWEPINLKNKYIIQTPEIQLNAHLDFIKRNIRCTNLCINEDEIQKELERLHVEAIIIGSDAVLQDHPFLSRLHFPTRKFISLEKITEERLFPNAFWGTFNKTRLPMALMSVSSQNSEYYWIMGKKRKHMYEALSKFSYISVRDNWTYKMVAYLTNGDILPEITPDPVFSFNNNIDDNLIPSKATILSKYGLPDDYSLISFRSTRLVNKEWLYSIKKEAQARSLPCVVLPMPNGVAFEHDFDYEIPIPLNPIDWYAIIKYSQGYIGENMHPVIVALHNRIPIYSFDTYGITRFANFVCDEKSSKIHNILSFFDLIKSNYTCVSMRYFKMPSAKDVFDAIINCDLSLVDKKCMLLEKKYIKMMSDILASFR